MSFLKFKAFKIIIKILKNVTNIVKPAVKVKKSNWKRFQSRSKRTEIKHVPFRDFGCLFRVTVKNDGSLKVPFHLGHNEIMGFQISR